MSKYEYYKYLSDTYLTIAIGTEDLSLCIFYKNVSEGYRLKAESLKLKEV